MFGNRRRERSVHDSGFDSRQPIHGIDFQDPSHAGERNHDPTRQGDGPARQSGPGATAYLLYTTNPTMNISFAGCWLYANNILAIRTVNSCRTAEAVFNLPGGCFGFTMFNQWAVSDSAATGGWALSNRGRIIL